MTPQGERLVVGLVRGVHGLRGAVRIEPLSDEPSRFVAGAELYLEGSTRRLTVAWAQPEARGILVRFREVRTREAAEELRDLYLEAVSAVTELGPDEYWWHEVIGVPVVTETGETLGSVEDVFRAGGGEVYVVRGGPRGELLVPAVRAVVRSFAPREGRLVVSADALGLEDLRPPRPRGRRSSRAARAAASTDSSSAASIDGSSAGSSAAGGADAGRPISG